MKLLIGILHVIFGFISSIYGLVTQKIWFDRYYIYYIIVALLSWSLFDGECFGTLICNKIFNVKNDDENDFNSVFKDKKYYFYYVSSLFITTILSIIIVFNRNYMPSLLTTIFVSLFFIYLVLLKFFKKSIYYIVCENITKIYCIFLIFYVFYKLK